MSRLAGWPAPTQALGESATCYERFEEMALARHHADAQITAWAARLDEDWVSQDLTWTSTAVASSLRASRGLVVLHMFNHQIHHRGQVHAMLTAAGESTGDTDLILVLPGSISREDVAALP